MTWSADSTGTARSNARCWFMIYLNISNAPGGQLADWTMGGTLKSRQVGQDRSARNGFLVGLRWYSHLAAAAAIGSRRTMNAPAKRTTVLVSVLCLLSVSGCGKAPAPPPGPP